MGFIRKRLLGNKKRINTLRKKGQNFPLTVITGSSGFIGSQVIELFNQYKSRLLLPSSKKLDIVNTQLVEKFLSKNRPQIFINFASFTNLAEAEKQRGDKNGLTWKLNVKATENIAKTCRKHNIFLIQISTDSVFPGTAKFPGPYSEKTIPPDKLKSLGWYSYTKLKGEEKVKKSGCNFAIIRISYPFGNIHSEKDFVAKTIKYIQEEIPLFKDQYFTPTFIPDLAKTLEVIITRKRNGIYHVACQEPTTPFEFAVHLAKKLSIRSKIKSQKLKESIGEKGWVPRAKYGGLLIGQTQNTLNLKFHSWQKAADKFIYQYETQTN